MPIAQEIYALIQPAVVLIAAELNGGPATTSLEERIHARIWPYVTHAVREMDPSAVVPQRDGRVKSWQYVVRFWAVGPIDDHTLLAESDAEVMQGTGSLPGIVMLYAAEMHAPEGEDDPMLRNAHLPAELSEEGLRERLPQLRNNLGRQGSAVLRIPYTIGEESFICQVDVIALTV